MVSWVKLHQIEKSRWITKQFDIVAESYNLIGLFRYWYNNWNSIKFFAYKNKINICRKYFYDVKNKFSCIIALKS